MRLTNPPHKAAGSGMRWRWCRLCAALVGVAALGCHAVGSGAWAAQPSASPTSTAQCTAPILGSCANGDLRTVPQGLRSTTPKVARKMLQSAGLCNVVTVLRPTEGPGWLAGRVMESNPKRGSRLCGAQRVLLYVSSASGGTGPKPVAPTMPPLVTLTVTQAKSALQARPVANFDLHITACGKTITDPAVHDGPTFTISQQWPPPGADLGPARHAIHLALRPALPQLPKLSGLTLDELRKRLGGDSGGWTIHPLPVPLPHTPTAAESASRDAPSEPPHVLTVSADPELCRINAVLAQIGTCDTCPTTPPAPPPPLPPPSPVNPDFPVLPLAGGLLSGLLAARLLSRSSGEAALGAAAAAAATPTAVVFRVQRDVPSPATPEA